MFFYDLCALDTVFGSLEGSLRGPQKHVSARQRFYRFILVGSTDVRLFGLSVLNDVVSHKEQFRMAHFAEVKGKSSTDTNGEGLAFGVQKDDAVVREADHGAVRAWHTFLAGYEDTSNDVAFAEGDRVGLSGAHAVDCTDDFIANAAWRGSVTAFASRDVEVTDFTDAAGVEDC